MDSRRTCVSPTRARSGLALGLAALAALVACGGGGTRGVRPDDMSAEDHRREAAKEGAAADKHGAAYDPAAIRGTPDRPLSGGGPEDYLYPTRVYDPGHYQQSEVARHRAHAAEHAGAAAELERFEEESCKDLPPSTRASCPLLGPATAIVDLERGVRVELAEGAPVAAVVALMRCHYAYARARAFAVADACPLYVRGVEIRVSADGRAVEILAGDAATVKHVQRRAREEAVPGAPTI